MALLKRRSSDEKTNVRKSALQVESPESPWILKPEEPYQMSDLFFMSPFKTQLLHPGTDESPEARHDPLHPAEPGHPVRPLSGPCRLRQEEGPPVSHGPSYCECPIHHYAATLDLVPLSSHCLLMGVVFIAPRLCLGPAWCRWPG